MITRTLNSSTSDIAFVSWKTPNRTGQLEIAEFAAIGREFDNQIVIDDTFVSARHARIERRPNGFLLRDLRSRNGTFVNGVRVLEVLLGNGDRIRIGETDLNFSWHRPETDAVISLSSRNPAWSAQLQRLSNIAQSHFPVLLTGPSGTGKDVVAQTIHAQSTRRAAPFVSVNCSALSESLVESELFGHVRGSFTGATENRKGAFEAARGGTLFLDEVGDLPLALQPKLLRALENSQIRPVGSDKAIETDVRIIAATHHDLKRLVLEERFRADLYFRLHVIQLQAPALKDRMEDFDDLFYLFARQLRVRFSHGAIARLREHAFPGNIRELRNIVTRAKAFAGSDEVMEGDVDHLVDMMPLTARPPAEPAPPARIVDAPTATPVVDLSNFRPSRSILRDIEIDMIKKRLIANRGNQRKTAADLGIPKSTLHDRLRMYGINIEQLLLEADAAQAP